MNMTRREFLKSAAVLAALAPFARLRAQDPATPPAEGADAKPRATGPITRRTMAGESVSLLGFGCMRLPRGGDGKIDRPAAERLWSRYLEAGGNYFDTAYMYHDGESEVAVGDFLSRRPRDSYFLVDKMPVWMGRSTRSSSCWSGRRRGASATSASRSTTRPRRWTRSSTPTTGSSR